MKSENESLVSSPDHHVGFLAGGLGLGRVSFVWGRVQARERDPREIESELARHRLTRIINPSYLRHMRLATSEYEWPRSGPPLYTILYTILEVSPVNFVGIRGSQDSSRCVQAGK